MKTRLFILGLALLAVAGFATPARAQQPGAPVFASYPQERAPMPGAPAPIIVHPAPCAPCTVKVCVPEVKKNTKVVYDSRCKDYCQKSCLQLLRGLFTGKCDCEANCGDVHTKRVLVKKTHPDCDTSQCVVKEVAAPPCVACPPCPPCGR
jgi:hypothetical protein